MGREIDENAPLLSHNGQDEPHPKFPLCVFPAYLRPYLELARIEKVGKPPEPRRDFLANSALANRIRTYVLALWYVIQEY